MDIEKVNAAEAAARKHATKCRKCCVPIVDDEGNPKYFSEACADGVRLLVAYVDSIGYAHQVPAWARKRVS